MNRIALGCMRRTSWWLGGAWLALAFLPFACGSEETKSGPAPSSDAGADSADSHTEGEATVPSCGSAGATLPAGLTELSYDDGVAYADIRQSSAQITVDGQTHLLAEVPLYEAVRFTLEHPAKIHGFRVRWSNVDPSAAHDVQIEAGLYPDFGYNGFDFWKKDPLWTGTRCAGDVTSGEWTHYALPAPITIDHPGLVYVAHLAATATAPVFAYGESAAESCEPFAACSSAFNLPEALGYYDGVSFPFQRNFLVRLLVEYTEEVAPEAKIFQEVAGPSGAHVSWGDYNHDGWEDVLVGGKLYRNDQGAFVDVTASSGVGAAQVSATGGVFGDFDNDGCLDLFLFSESATSPDALLRSNCDGTFSDVTAASTINDLQNYEDCGDTANVHTPTAAAAWVDLDQDGLLDLYLANFICWGKETFYLDQVFRNQGGGVFEEWTGSHGFGTVKLASRGVAPADIDGDGDVDLFVNNYRLQRNQLYVNQGDGTFLEQAAQRGAAGVLSLFGYFGHTIGAAWGDLDNDGDLDLVAANLAHPRFFDFSDKTQILLNDGSGVFTDKAGAWETPFGGAGLRFQETHSVPVLADFDQDGVLDLAITAVYDGRPTDFYWGNGDGTFRLDAYRAGITTTNGWGAASADFDNGGDPDLFASSLFRNTLAPGDKGKFLQVRVIGNAGSNRSGIGSRVVVHAAGKQWLRQVSGGNGKGGQDSLTLHFGLGATSSVDKISIHFPGGKQVEIQGPLPVDQRLWIFEDGTHHSGFAPPP